MRRRLRKLTLRRRMKRYKYASLARNAYGQCEVGAANPSRWIGTWRHVAGRARARRCGRRREVEEGSSSLIIAPIFVRIPGSSTSMLTIKSTNRNRKWFHQREITRFHLHSQTKAIQGSRVNLHQTFPIARKVRILVYLLQGGPQLFFGQNNWRQ